MAKPTEEQIKQNEEKSMGQVLGVPPEQEQKLQEDLQKFINKGTILVHSEQSRDKIIKMLTTGNPLEAVANTTVMVMQRLDKAARDAGQEVHDYVKLQAAVDLTGQVAEVGAASGTIPQLSEEELQTSLSVGIEKFLKGEIEAGRVDPEGLKAELGRGISQMPPEQQMGLDKQLRTINQTAMQSQGRAIQSEVQRGGLL